MEIKINKEIRGYKENVFFGLSIRQFTCAALALAACVAVYFLGRDALGEELVSWACIGCAAPLGFLGFFRYNGMTAERFIWAFIKSSFLCSGKRLFRVENIYYRAIQEARGPSAFNRRTIKKMEG